MSDDDIEPSPYAAFYAEFPPNAVMGGETFQDVADVVFLNAHLLDGSDYVCIPGYTPWVRYERRIEEHKDGGFFLLFDTPHTGQWKIGPIAMKDGF